jgi:hypothetical protein
MTFGRAFTDSFHISVMHESVARIREPTISEVKGECSDDCATETPQAPNISDDCVTEAPIFCIFFIQFKY